MSGETELCRLARKYGSDKGGNHLKAGDTCHRYTEVYDKLFCDKRYAIKYILEIGVGHGCSLRMWEEYFSSANIVGLDNNPACLINEGRIRCFFADQASGDMLDRALKPLKQKFDIIVDDGSHVADHQIFTANFLEKYLAPEGIYFIEDILFDCRPEKITEKINWGTWAALPVGFGLGRAHCECGGCNVGEVLLAGSR